jgi:hypothetical protein
MRFVLELEKRTISRSGESSTDGGGKEVWDPEGATGIECRLNPRGTGTDSADEIDDFFR